MLSVEILADTFIRKYITHLPDLLRFVVKKILTDFNHLKGHRFVGSRAA